MGLTTPMTRLGVIVPQDVVRARVHPSVTVIPENAFNNCLKLEEVELCVDCWRLVYVHSIIAGH